MIKAVKGFINLIKYWRQHPIASKDLSGTIIRFLRWQFGARLIKAPIVWPWISNTKLIIEKGMTGATMNIYCGLHEFHDMGFLLHFLRPNDLFVDIGANVGTYTILASGVIGAKTLCVEPIPSTFKNLKANIAVNEIGELVQAECCGLGESDGAILTFIADQDTTNRIAPNDYTGNTIDVPIRSLDSLLDSKEAIFWKIDVEGFEEYVLAGATKALESNKLVAIEIEGDSLLIRETLKNRGFEIYNYNPFLRTLVLEDNKNLGHNWLWIKNINIAKDRCKSSNKISIDNVNF